MKECHVRGNNIKYIRISEEMMEKAKNNNRVNEPSNRGRGRGNRGGRGTRGSRGRGSRRGASRE